LLRGKREKIIDHPQQSNRKKPEELTIAISFYP